MVIGTRQKKNHPQYNYSILLSMTSFFMIWTVGCCVFKSPSYIICMIQCSLKIVSTIQKILMPQVQKDDHGVREICQMTPRIRSFYSVRNFSRQIEGRNKIKKRIRNIAKLQ